MHWRFFRNHQPWVLLTQFCVSTITMVYISTGKTIKKGKYKQSIHFFNFWIECNVKFMPSFEILSVDKEVCYAGAALCVKVVNFDGSNDFISVKESPRSITVLTGKLLLRWRKAIIILADQDKIELYNCRVFFSGN